MSETIYLKKLWDITNVDWFIPQGGQIKRKDGSYNFTDYYLSYLYDPANNEPVSISYKMLQWIKFRMISPRTRNNGNRIGQISIAYKFMGHDQTIQCWCYKEDLKNWLVEHITSGLHVGQMTHQYSIPQHRYIIQQKGLKAFEKEMNQFKNYNNKDEEEAFYNYSNYSREDMINDAFEGDESLYWNIDDCE